MFRQDEGTVIENRSGPYSRISLVIAALLLAVLAACGGGSSNPASATPTPTPNPTPTPTPTPTGPPGAFVCSAIGGFFVAPQGIINGLVCSSSTSPVVLLWLEKANGGVSICSGTVIAPNAVLTAAHCLTPDIEHVDVLLGGMGSPRIAATSFKPIPEYDKNNDLSPDVGVVFVDQSLGKAPVPLLVNRDGVVGEQGVIAGYGVDTPDTQSYGVLRAGTVTILRSSGNYITADFYRDVSNVCYGDSGGPLLLQQGGTWSIAGVTSGMTSGCLSGTSFYTRLRNDSIASFVFNLVPSAGRQ